MTIDTCEGSKFFDSADPSVCDQLVALSGPRATEARKLLNEAITPQVLTEALCGSYEERRSLRVETTTLLAEIATPEILAARAREEQHGELRETWSTAIRARIVRAPLNRAA